ncbi:MAG: AF1514 family protein [Deltaproteobacteria bacterium]|nr:AF1514 family protein [Deltaproteobacteria bacterium]
MGSCSWAGEALGNAMQRIELTVTGCEPDYGTAAKIALAIAEQDGQEPLLIAWYDRRRDKHSPGCLKPRRAQSSQS